MDVRYKKLKSGQYDPSPNLLVRLVGNGCYMADVDCAQYIFKPDGSTETVGFFEWKHFRVRSISFTDLNCDCRASLRYVRDLANREQVPFFIGITYTKEEDGYGSAGLPPMWFLVPANERALLWVPREGQWMTQRQIGRLLIQLRGRDIDLDKLQHLNHDYRQYDLLAWIDPNLITTTTNGETIA